MGAAGRAEEGPVTAWVTTMKGCDERCSFCIVPYTRGPERYRPALEIVTEIQRWVAAGAREVTLLGQTVDSFRDPALPPVASNDPDESQFPALLAAIARDVPGLARLRYTSPHPRHLTPSLVQAHAELDVRRRSFTEVVAGLDEAAARREAERCLSCGTCFECDGCYGACPEDAVIKLGPGLRYQFDYDRCTGCAICFEQCPCHAISMVPEP